MTVNIDELGPVDWIVVEFPTTKMTGEIAPIIKDYIDRGLIKVLDLLFLQKDQDGGVEAFEASDLDDSALGELRGEERDLAMVLSEQDVADLAVTIEPGSSAAVLVWENRCCCAVRRGGALRRVSWSPAGASDRRRCWPPSRPTLGRSRHAHAARRQEDDRCRRWCRGRRRRHAPQRRSVRGPPRRPRGPA